MIEYPATVCRAQKIVTLAGDRPEAFAVVGEHIVGTGQSSDLVQRFPRAEEVDFGDGVVVPSFNDAHMHPPQAADDLLHVDVSAAVVRSNADVHTRLRGAAAETLPSAWLQASRYDDGKIAEGRVLTRWDLDSAVPEHPTIVEHVAGHWAIVNSRALAAAGLDDSSIPPEGGAYGRDASGHLNGIVYERALSAFRNPSIDGRPPVIPPTGLEDRLIGLQRALRQFHAAGLTSIGDASTGPPEILLYQIAPRRRLLTARVNMLVGYAHFDVIRKVGLLSGFGGRRLRFNGVKAFVDGAIGGRTCLLEEPFEGTQDYGMQTISTRDLADLVRAVHTGGWRLGVHANGDRAISLLLDQFEAAEADFHRALDGHTPASAEDIMHWLEETARGWNADPTPFIWAGRRHLRRQRAYLRRHPQGGSGACTTRPIRRRPVALTYTGTRAK